MRTAYSDNSMPSEKRHGQQLISQNGKYLPKGCKTFSNLEIISVFFNGN